MGTEVRDFGLSAGGGVNTSTGWFPEGQLPGTVNDGARSVMAAVRRALGDLSGEKTATYSGQVYTLASNQDVSALARGHAFAFIADAANASGSASIAINGLAGVDIKVGSRHLATNEIAAKQAVLGIYDGAALQMVGAGMSGLQFIARYTGAGAGSLDIEAPLNSVLYSGYVLFVEYLYPTTNASSLIVRLKQSGSYPATAYNSVLGFHTDGTPGAFEGAAATTGIFLTVASTGSSTADNGWTGQLVIANAHSAINSVAVTGTGWYRSSSGAYVPAWVGGTSNGQATLQGIRFLASAGNITYGISLFGIRKV